MKKIVYPIIIILMFGWPPGCSKEQSSENVIPADRSSVNDSSLQVNTKWTGDFGGMVERRFVRVLVPFSKTFYFVDKGKQRGITYEMLGEFEKYVNKKLKKKTLKIHVIIIPTTRDKLLSGLTKGWGDIAAANLTITPKRLKEIDFSDPFLTGVSELIISGPGVKSLANIDDLAGKEIYVRKSSSYYESLLRLNKRFEKNQKKQMRLVLANENLEDEDLLEMVNAGIVPMIVVDSHKAQFWAQIFDTITVHSNLAVNAGGQIAWAFRKNSPKLREVINEFVKDHKKGTLMGNMLFRRYLRNTDYVKNSLAGEEIKKFRQTVALFEKYAGMYDFDYLIIAAQAYQESGLDHSKRSRAGAIGIMQVLQSTAADPKINIPDIEKLESNIHAGVKYMRFIINNYLKEEKIDKLNKTLFAFASYNAGPTRVVNLRKEASTMGLDPDIWFGNVEVVAAKRIGRETVQYVSNIFKYYIAYRMLIEQTAMKEKARGSMQR